MEKGCAATIQSKGVSSQEGSVQPIARQNSCRRRGCFVTQEWNDSGTVPLNSFFLNCANYSISSTFLVIWITWIQMSACQIISGNSFDWRKGGLLACLRNLHAASCTAHNVTSSFVSEEYRKHAEQSLF